MLAKLAEEHPRLRKTELERLVEAWFRRALQGDTEKGKVLLAYAFGKPVQQSENININSNERLSVEEADAIIKSFFLAQPVTTPVDPRPPQCTPMRFSDDIPSVRKVNKPPGNRDRHV